MVVVNGTRELNQMLEIHQNDLLDSAKKLNRASNHDSQLLDDGIPNHRGWINKAFKAESGVYGVRQQTKIVTG